ncbi:hypothetical protein DUNSADRAFT_6693 [Dunaliella salina]|uniref:Uncharacterized protein n=1 Tax=Dunaliella salina TaxID=3046 RepID=A0ABQ7GMQ4_DUNSA|nr:hypothetical protein DUNSADRAFT_6693 [Dunaliella salina]|eukprot:KAF5835880.1 hypothetical protein DUNSADRAFT_6693 [Dunaliella salina]
MAEASLLAHFLGSYDDSDNAGVKREREEDEQAGPQAKREHRAQQEEEPNHTLSSQQQDGHHQPQQQQQQQQQQQHGEVKPEEEDDDENQGVYMPRSSSRAAVKKGTECPYLDTVSRQNLDFDFEKCCSVTLTHVNVYVCLVCGKYYQGRSLHTQAYTHSLETGHHMFMKLDNGKVYCLPDNYEVVDRSLDDVRHVLDPRFTPADVAKLDKDVTWARSLDGTEYMPGLVGLNNMKRHDYANTIVQILARIPAIRDFFLIPENYKGCKSLLVSRCGELLRKIWNTRNFKGQVSPHEFMQAVILASKKRFTLDTQSDPVEFASWLLNALHADLTGGKIKKQSIITKCFQGELEVTTEKGTGKGKAATAAADVVERMPFLLLGLDLPPAPLFKDTLEKNIIPQALERCHEVAFEVVKSDGKSRAYRQCHVTTGSIKAQARWHASTAAAEASLVPARGHRSGALAVVLVVKTR